MDTYRIGRLAPLTGVLFNRRAVSAPAAAAGDAARSRSLAPSSA
ncbi:MAG: hypothetical protein QOD82_7557 [Pseudonocardiales bacterium]|nr:hypothetical protein [Pseudonocardiales bacterium]